MANTQAPLSVCSSTPSSWPLLALVLTRPSGCPPLMTDLYGAWLFSVQQGVASRKKLRGHQDNSGIGSSDWTGEHPSTWSSQECAIHLLKRKKLLCRAFYKSNSVSRNRSIRRCQDFNFLWWTFTHHHCLRQVKPPSGFASVKRNMIHQAPDHCSWGSNIYFIYIQRICKGCFLAVMIQPMQRSKQGNINRLRVSYWLLFSPFSLLSFQFSLSSFLLLFLLYLLFSTRRYGCYWYGLYLIFRNYRISF